MEKDFAGELIADDLGASAAAGGITVIIAFPRKLDCRRIAATRNSIIDPPFHGTELKRAEPVERELSGAERGEVGACHECGTQLPQNAVECGDRHAGWRRDFNADRASVSSQIDYQARLDPTRPGATVASPAREVEVRRQGPAVPKRDFEIRSVRGAHGVRG